MITGMDFVSLPVKDMARAKAFYKDELGLTPGLESGANWSEFDLGDGPALALIDPIGYGMPVESTGNGSVGLAFQDFTGTSERMNALGLRQMEPFETEVCHGSPSEDSEGNSIVVHQRKSGPGRDREIDFVSLPVADMARAKAFYTDTLGLTLDAEFSGDTWAEFQLPDDTTLALFNVGAMGMDFEANKGGAVGLRVPAVEDAFAKLKALGFAQMDEILETHVCFMAFVHDSEGNSLILHRHK
jgi:catechol 2,3-dioxygenase-like lactoylglutathione lyase family enzyme